MRDPLERAYSVSTHVGRGKWIETIRTGHPPSL
jgi:hypothetical protein